MLTGSCPRAWAKMSDRGKPVKIKHSRMSVVAAAFFGAARPPPNVFAPGANTVLRLP